MSLAECMDEINMASRRSVPRGSDAIFEAPHVDGPFGFIAPLCRMKRCLTGIVVRGSPITTHFPLDGSSHVLKEGEMLCFDYNQDHHYVSGNSSESLRVVAKTHVALAPLESLLPFCVAIHCYYNSRARELFNATLQNKSVAGELQAFVANIGPFVTRLDLRLGFVDFILALYLAARAKRAEQTGAESFLSAISPAYGAFLCATLLFGNRGGLGARAFARSARTLKLAQTAATTLALRRAPSHLQIAAALGHALSLWAYTMLGDERTYYGAELGVVPRSFESRGPYAFVSHPMLIGSLLPLLSVAAHARRTRAALLTGAALLVCASALESSSSKFEEFESFYRTRFEAAHRSRESVAAHIAALWLSLGSLRRALGEDMWLSVEAAYALTLRAAGVGASPATLAIALIHFVRPSRISPTASLLIAAVVQDAAHLAVGERALAYADPGSVAQLTLLLPALLSRRVLCQ
jgi:hypothetical protein